MKDNENRKALESYGWAKLYHESGKLPELDLGEVLKLVEHYEAEIERLIHNLEAIAQSFPNCAKAERAEAVKEFAERLKENTVTVKIGKQTCRVITVDGIDYYKKEMVGER